jgi:hypothetical protein
MAPLHTSAQHKRIALLAGGGIAAAAVAAMAWKALAGSAAAPMLPPAERVQQLAHAEQLFASKFPDVSTTMVWCFFLESHVWQQNQTMCCLSFLIL